MTDIVVPCNGKTRFILRRVKPTHSSRLSLYDGSLSSRHRPVGLRYDGFILDLWGVVHDGIAPVPGAIDCMYALISAGKRIVLAVERTTAG